jgi:hypothetical protein
VDEPAIKAVVDEQADDDGLWFIPVTITEDILQKALRRLHAVIEGKTPEQCAMETPANAIPFSFHEGDRVAKRGGDYSFVGVVLAAFSKRSGSPRYAVENDAGLIHIFNGEQLVLIPEQQER